MINLEDKLVGKKQKSADGKLKKVFAELQDMLLDEEIEDIKKRIEVATEGIKSQKKYVLTYMFFNSVIFEQDIDSEYVELMSKYVSSEGIYEDESNYFSSESKTYRLDITKPVITSRILKTFKYVLTPDGKVFLDKLEKKLKKEGIKLKDIDLKSFDAYAADKTKFKIGKSINYSKHFRDESAHPAATILLTLEFDI